MKFQRNRTNHRSILSQAKWSDQTVIQCSQKGKSYLRSTVTHRILNNIMGLIKDQTDHLSLIEVGNEFVPGIRSMETSLWQIFTNWLTVVIFCVWQNMRQCTFILYQGITILNMPGAATCIWVAVPTCKFAELIFHTCLASPLFICFLRHWGVFTLDAH